MCITKVAPAGKWVRKRRFTKTLKNDNHNNSKECRRYQRNFRYGRPVNAELSISIVYKCAQKARRAVFILALILNGEIIYSWNCLWWYNKDTNIDTTTQLNGSMRRCCFKKSGKSMKLKEKGPNSAVAMIFNGRNGLLNTY